MEIQFKQQEIDQLTQKIQEKDGENYDIRKSVNINDSELSQKRRKVQELEQELSNLKKS